MHRILVLLTLLLAVSAARAENAILVLDESGSMWAQLEGKTYVIQDGDVLNIRFNV